MLTLRSSGPKKCGIMMFLAVVSVGVMIYEKHPWDVALLRESSPLPASQPVRHPVLLVGKCCPALPVGTGWGWRFGPGLCWCGCWEHCPELSEQLRGRPLVGGRRCRVLTDPPRAGSLTTARGRPSACDLPLQAWFLLPPGISAVRQRLAL